MTRLLTFGGGSLRTAGPRACETRLNALPQFRTEIDGEDIHFIHVRSPHRGALPLIITHGWPGSVIELLEVIGPLTDLDHDKTTYGHVAGLFAGQPYGAITRDDVLDNTSLYWLTNTATSAARLYWEQAVTGKKRILRRLGTARAVRRRDPGGLRVVPLAAARSRPAGASPSTK